MTAGGGIGVGDALARLPHHHPLARARVKRGLEPYRVPDITHPSIMIEAHNVLRPCRGEGSVLIPGDNRSSSEWAVGTATGFEEFITGLSSCSHPDRELSTI